MSSITQNKKIEIDIEKHNNFVKTRNTFVKILAATAVAGIALFFFINFCSGLDPSILVAGSMGCFWFGALAAYPINVNDGTIDIDKKIRIIRSRTELP